MKKRVLSLMLVLALCMGSALPALAYDSARVDTPILISSTGSANNYDPGANNNVAFIDKNGTLWMVGYNYGGQLGIGTRDSSDTPVKVMEDVVSVSVGSYHVAAIKSDGSLWMWGDNTDGTLGNGRVGNVEEDAYGATGDYICQTVPIKVMDDVVAVSCGSNHTAAIKSDGSLWMWGESSGGALGNGGAGTSYIWAVNFQIVPVKIMDDVKAVSCGAGYTAIVKNDGSLWMCGTNSSGNLGIGTSGVQNKEDSKQMTPVKVMDNVVSAYCYSGSTAAIKTDGSLWMWGKNHYSQLGNNFGGDYKTPVHLAATKEYIRDDIYQTTPVKVLDDVVAVSMATLDNNLETTGAFTCAVRTDGSLWAWGEVRDLNRTFEGAIRHPQRGLGPLIGKGVDTVAVQPVPAKIMDDVAAVSGGFVVKKDGSLVSLVDGYEWIKNVSVKTPGGSTQTTPSTTPSAPAVNAVLSPQKLAVDGENIDCEKYNIGGSNYFKLRDLAQLLNGTGSQFGVGFDAAASTVTITTGAAYESTGTELMAGGDKSSTAQPSAQSILIDGVKHDELTAYNIGGSNFFRLRELGNVLGFEVGYDQDTNTAIVHSVQK